MDGGPDSRPGAGGRCCVVVAPPGEPPAADLVRVLERRGFTLVHAADAHDAMVRLLQARAAAPSLALLVAQPGRVPLAAALRLAAERHVAGVSIWRYDEDAQPRLRTFDAEPAPGQAPAVAPARTGGLPRLRLAGELADVDETPAPAPAHALSEEEMRLLLGSDEDDTRGVR